MIYQVRDWSKHFENDRSKSRERCSFVCVPNKQHGMGFLRVVSEPDGSSIYGIWQMILGACSQQGKPREGWLTDTGRGPDGESAVSPWGVDDLAMKFRRPASEIERALVVLSSESVGWLLKHTDSPSTHRQVTVNSPPTHLERREEKGIEEKRIESVNGVGIHPTLILQRKIGLHFGRVDSARWAYTEETALADVCGRHPEVLAEWVEIEAFKQRMDDPKYFPASVGSLLEKWDSLLDRARKPAGEVRQDVTQMKTSRDSIVRLIDSHPANRGSVCYRTDHTPEQRSDLDTLKTRRQDLERRMAML